MLVVVVDYDRDESGDHYLGGGQAGTCVIPIHVPLPIK